MRRHRPSILCLALLLVGTAASAERFTVMLKNGTSFDTRYRPVDAEWDENVAMFLTDQGNWVALDKTDIADVTSATEASGFGYQLDTTTILLGWTPNDLVTEDENGALKPTYGGQEGPQTPVLPDYTLQQFVDPGQLGTGGTGGIPLIFGSVPEPTM